MGKRFTRMSCMLLTMIMVLSALPVMQVSAISMEAAAVELTITDEPAQASAGVRFPVNSYTTCLTYGSPNINYTYASSKARLDQYGTDWWGAHHGTEYFAVDLSGGGASNGSPVYAVADGVVVWRRDSYGQIVVKHTVPLTLSDGKTTYNTWYSTYVHMKNVSVSSGQTVSGGQEIGKVGNTGTVDPHLHFSLSTFLHDGYKTFHYYDNAGATQSYENVMKYAYLALNPRWVYPSMNINVKSIDNDAMDKEAISRFNLGVEYAPGNSKNGTQYGQSAPTAPYYTDVAHSNVTHDNAKLKANVQNPSGKQITNGGLYLSTKEGAVTNGIKFMDSVPASYQTKTVIPCGYDLRDECKYSLAHGTTYYYVFYVVDAYGAYYYSNEFSFKTDASAGSNHYYVPVVTPPSCEDKGYTTHTCGCGDSYQDTYVDALGHSYTDDKDATCNVCDHERQLEAEEKDTVSVYRLYNPYTQEHLLTGSADERDALVSVGWHLDGIAWMAPEDGIPVYRLYNPYDDWHTYTTDPAERDTMEAAGWSVDGVVSFGYDGANGRPIYRLFNPYVQTNFHLFTADGNERDTLVNAGWKLEGVAWYAVK